MDTFFEPLRVLNSKKNENNAMTLGVASQKGLRPIGLGMT